MSCECDCEEEVTLLGLGDDVPEFTLKTFEPTKGDFGEFSLAKTKEAKRWSILFFYPADFTFVCATEFAALAEQHEAFSKLGADIVTVSTDTEYVHLAWQQHEVGLKNVKYSMGADTTAEISQLFGVYDENSGLALRGTFIINPEGKLLASEVNYYNVGRNIDELLRKFKAYLHVTKNPVEACPSKWRNEGDSTLAPSAKMVGNVFKADGTY